MAYLGKIAGFTAPGAKRRSTDGLVSRQLPAMARVGGERAFDPSTWDDSRGALLVDDDGNAYSAEGNTGLSQDKSLGEQLVAARKGAIQANETAAMVSGKKLPGTGSSTAPDPVWDGMKGIIALQENARAARGQNFRVRTSGAGGSLRALGDAAKKTAPEPWSLGGATDGSAWSLGGATDGSAWSLGGGSQKDTSMPQQRTPARQPSVPMDEVEAAAQSGSGSSYALAKKRQELEMAALESALMRQRLADQDPDGSQADAVARGRAIQNEYDYAENRAPRVQTARNAVGALAGAAKRDEWQKDWQSQAPQRDFQEQQYQTRYVEPARVRGDAALGVADVAGASRENVATTNAAGRTDAASMTALGNAIREMVRQGAMPDATAYGETAGVLPQPTIGQRLRRLQEERPNLTPENYVNLLGDLDEDEYAEAMRLLGGA